MKKIRVNCGALTRMEYSKVMEVPDDTTLDDLQRIARDVYDETDGSEFWPDNEYWERGECWCEVISDEDYEKALAQEKEDAQAQDQQEADQKKEGDFLR